MRKNVIGSKLGLALLGAAAFALVGAAAWATIPDGGGLIHACYDNQSGQVRLYDSEGSTPKGCGKNETAVSWNQVGPIGPMGPAGAQGHFWTRNLTVYADCARLAP